VNVGGGEPTVRADFWELVAYATVDPVGVKFLHERRQGHAGAGSPPPSDYVDVRISVDGATLEVNDAVRGPDSFRTATTAMRHLADADFRDL
jgi:MoaA/NifB/PqqE/SkfB family radical SAM enzyme